MTFCVIKQWTMYLMVTTVAVNPIVAIYSVLLFFFPLSHPLCLFYFFSFARWYSLSLSRTALRKFVASLRVLSIERQSRVKQELRWTLPCAGKDESGGNGIGGERRKERRREEERELHGLEEGKKSARTVHRLISYSIHGATKRHRAISQALLLCPLVIESASCDINLLPGAVATCNSPWQFVSFRSLPD